MATTKTKTALTPEQLAAEKNEATRASLILAEEKVQALELAMGEADLAADAIPASWNAGDPSYSASDLNLAQVELVRATALYEAALRSVQTLERSFVNTDASLAKTVRPWICAALPGVPVHAGISMSHDATTTLPVAYVVQSTKAESLGGGVFKGSVDVTYLRSPLHREIDSAKVEHAASLAGCEISAAGSSYPSGDGQATDRMRVKINYGHATPAVIREEPTEAMASKLAGKLAYALVKATTPSGGRIEMLKDGALSNDVMTARPNGGEVVKSETDATGSRLSEVRVKLTYWKHGSRELSTPIESRLRTLVADYAETFTQGLGICESAKTAGIDSPDHSGLTNVTLLLTFASATR
jgi:hypothetical protein